MLCLMTASPSRSPLRLIVVAQRCYKGRNSQIFSNKILFHSSAAPRCAVLVWKCRHDGPPRYLADLCVPAHFVRGRQQLRSTASGTLLVPRTRTSTGQRSFAVNGPRTWNSLPDELRTPDMTLYSFNHHLKAHLFRQ